MLQVLCSGPALCSVVWETSYPRLSRIVAVDDVDKTLEVASVLSVLIQEAKEKYLDDLGTSHCACMISANLV
jgi:hypothetical protein